MKEYSIHQSQASLQQKMAASDILDSFIGVVDMFTDADLVHLEEAYRRVALSLASTDPYREDYAELQQDEEEIGDGFDALLMIRDPKAWRSDLCLLLSENQFISARVLEVRRAYDLNDYMIAGRMYNIRVGHLNDSELLEMSHFMREALFIRTELTFRARRATLGYNYHIY